MELSQNLNKISSLFDDFVKEIGLKIAKLEFADVEIPSQEVGEHIETETSTLDAISHNNSLKDQIEKEIEVDIITLIQDFFRILNLAVIQGEYSNIDKVDFLKEKLHKDCQSFTEEIKELFTINYEEYYVYVREVCNVIENAINRFVELMVRFNQTISSNKKTFLSLNSLDHKGDRNFRHFEGDNDTLFSILHYNETLYDLNVYASVYDFSMEYAHFEDIIRTLQNGILWIGGIKNTHIVLSDPIKEKCGFLCFKIMSRIRAEDPSVTFLIDSTPYDIDVTNTFEEWSKHIFRHYEINGETTAKEDIKSIKDSIGTNYSKLRFSEIHLLVKFYKDCSSYLHTETLDNLYKIIESKYHGLVKDKNSNKFNKFAHKFALNYVLNNQLSDLIKKNGSDEGIHSLYGRICKTQEETNIDNFFPHSKYLDYILNKIASLIKASNIFDNIDEIEPLLAKARNVFKKYDQNVYWSQRKYNYIFYLSFDECFVDYNDQDLGPIKIFIASSFTLPLRKEKYIQDFEENKKRLVNIERSIEVLQIVAKEHKEIKEKSEHLAKEVKTKEIKYIEILSIFAAIIVFAAGSFTTMLNVARGVSFNELRGVILSIGLILFLFISVVFFISQVPFSKLWGLAKRHKLQKITVFFLMLIPITAIICGAFYYLNRHIDQDYKEFLSEQKEIISKQDSIIFIQSQNILRQDSILLEQTHLLNQSTQKNKSR